MRGLDQTRSRLPRARAFFAGVAMIAGALASAAGAQATGNDETAMAVPRLSPPNGNQGVALPQPLNPSDASLLRDAFELQARGRLAAADRAIVRLQSDLLLGPLQADRYLGRFHVATASELTDWLHHYANQPDALAIRALLRRRLPKGAALPPLPKAAALPLPAQAAVPITGPVLIPPVIPRQPKLEAAVTARMDHGNTAAALQLIGVQKDISPAYASLLRGDVARTLFTRNDDGGALHVALLASHESSREQDVGTASYVGGLAAWRLGNITEARQLFKRAAAAPLASARTQAAAAFWSARAADLAHDPADAIPWLKRAAAQRTTLHGLIARRLLGLPTGIVPSGALLSQADVDAVAATEGGWRAFALLQVDQPERAAVELRDLWSSAAADPPLRRAVLLVAAGVGLTECAGQIAALGEAADPDASDFSRFAMPALHPLGGFRIDPALVYALTRVESNFDPVAVSAVGAKGLMQLMPATADYIRAQASLRGGVLSSGAGNLELGQRYLLMLSRQDRVGDNLLWLLASYNAGPNGFLRWNTGLRDNGDPLMFIEAIPYDETRRFVERTLTFSWIYAARLHLPAPSLDAMAAGEFPRFTARGGERKITEAGLH